MKRVIDFTVFFRVEITNERDNSISKTENVFVQCGTQDLKME